MAVALAVIVAATAVFVGVMLLRPGRVDHDQLRGFGLVGAAALMVVSVAVVILAVVGPPHGAAETLAVLALIGIALYLAVAWLVIMVVRRREAGRIEASAPPYDPPGRHARGDRPGQHPECRSPDQP